MIRSHSRQRLTLLIAVFVSSASGLAVAIEEQQASSSSRSLRAEVQATQEGRVYMDPATKAWVNHPVTQEQQRVAAKVTKMLQDSDGETPIQVLPNGMTRVLLDERYEDTMRLERRADGTAHIVCGDSNDAPEQHSVDHHALDQKNNVLTSAIREDR